MTVIETLLSDLPSGWRVTDVYAGANWILSLVRHYDGSQRAGAAAAPLVIPSTALYQIGYLGLDQPSNIVAAGLRSPDLTEAAVGLATINALNQPDENSLTTADAADWLAAQCAGKNIAIFGRFPFIDEEVRPHARRVWVFEQQPQGGELDSAAMQTVLPQADVVAITASAIINHTIDQILPHVRSGSTVVLLGPSTPLSSRLFNAGINALFGVRVVDLPRVIEGVMAGSGFQKIEGLQRVALFKPQQQSKRDG